MTATRRLPDLMKAYDEYTAESESPAIFHMWIALGTIAGAAQRKIVMHAAHYDVHTNMYIILVSPPGVGKKSTALRIGKNFLRDVEPKVNFATECSSAAALIQAMSQIKNPAHQSISLFSSELGSLLGTDSVTMVDFLTDIYDCNPDWQKQTISRQLEAIKHPWLNLMAGTTPSWLGDNLSNTAVEGGLIARSIFQYSEELILKDAFPESSPRQLALKKEIVHDLSIIAALEGEFRFEGGKQGDAYKFYDAWYKDRERLPKVMDARTASYHNRKHIHALKVAMALSLSYKNELIITLEDIQRALVMLNASEPGMQQAFSAVGKNELATDLERVLRQIRARPGVEYKELLAANYNNLGKRGLDGILDELQLMGSIVNHNRRYTADVGGNGVGHH